MKVVLPEPGGCQCVGGVREGSGVGRTGHADADDGWRRLFGGCGGVSHVS